MTKREKIPEPFSPSHHRRGHELGTHILNTAPYSFGLMSSSARRNTGTLRAGRIGITRPRRRASGRNQKVSHRIVLSEYLNDILTLLGVFF